MTFFNKLRKCINKFMIWTITEMIIWRVLKGNFKCDDLNNLIIIANHRWAFIVSLRRFTILQAPTLLALMNELISFWCQLSLWVYFPVLLFVLGFWVQRWPISGILRVPLKTLKCKFIKIKSTHLQFQIG